MRRGSGRIIGGLVAALALVAVPTGASAEITVAPAFTILYVKGDDGPNQIAVECRDGLVTVNDSPAADGQASCADLEKLRVFGFGGDDTITLSGFAASLGGQSSNPFGGYGTQPEFSVDGGDGNDILRGDATGEQLSGGAGNDVASAPGALAAFMSGGPGNDRLFGKALLIDAIAGGPGADQIGGGAVLNFDLGGSGADTIIGGGQIDFEAGGSGRDKLVGKAGHDLLIGQVGPDAVFGGPGRDILAGGPGRDRLRGGPGRDKEFPGGLPRRELRHLPGLDVGLGSRDTTVAITTRLLKRFRR